MIPQHKGVPWVSLMRQALSYVRFTVVVGCTFALVLLATHRSILPPALATVQPHVSGSPPNQGVGSDYLLQRHTWGSAGTNAASATYRLRGTLGQDSIGNGTISTNATYQLQSGFWAGLSLTNGGTPTSTVTGTPPTSTPTHTPTVSNTPPPGTTFTPTSTWTPTPTPSPTTATPLPSFTPTPTMVPGETHSGYMPLTMRNAPTPLPPTVTPSPTVQLPTCEAVDHEPNGLFEQADNHLPFCEGANVEGAVSSINDVRDLYRLEVTVPMTIRITLTNLPPGADYDLYLDQGPGANVAYSTTTGSANETITAAVAPGRYYVRVIALQDGNPNRYRLRWSRN